jgi:hypothetical protein
MANYEFNYLRLVEKFKQDTDLDYKINKAEYIQYCIMVNLDRIHSMFPDLESIQKCTVALSAKLGEIRDKIEEGNKLG